MSLFGRLIKPAIIPATTEHMISEDIILKNRLPEALAIAINALEADTFAYKWDKPSTCNCGIVISAIAESRNALPLFLFARGQTTYKPERHTWRELCQNSCSVTGKPLTEVFQQLEEMGLSPKDIVHLEYMTNKAILQESGINTKEEYYHTKSGNLVKYLKAWLRIISKEADRTRYNERQQLEADLLIATATEDYETADGLSKRIAKMA